MGKEKKKSLGIKTTRYFTKTCTKCKFEYPNWFTNCPKCGAAWDSVEAEKTTGAKEALKKTIKIIVKITEEDFNNTLERVKLIFSADQFGYSNLHLALTKADLGIKWKWRTNWTFL